MSSKSTNLNSNDSPREIVKKYAAFYRESELNRQNNEDYNHFLANNPELEKHRDVLDNMIE